VLAQTTLRALLAPLGKQPIDVDPREAKAMLEPFAAQLENDFMICCEVANQLAALDSSGVDAQRATAEAAETENLRLESSDE
jgi:hypothetical protein